MDNNMDPEELRGFAKALKEYFDCMEDETKSIFSKYQSLEWHDRKYDELGDALDELRSQIYKFIGENEVIPDALDKLAAIVEEAQGVNIKG